MPTNKLPEPVTLSFFQTGLFTNRSPFFHALKPIGVSVVSFQDAIIDGL